MAGPRIDRKTLNKAKPENLIRLGKYVKVNTPQDDCVCEKCISRLVELIVRKLDIQDIEGWPPRILERKW